MPRNRGRGVPSGLLGFILTSIEGILERWQMKEMRNSENFQSIFSLFYQLDSKETNVILREITGMCISKLVLKIPETLFQSQISELTLTAENQ